MKFSALCWFIGAHLIAGVMAQVSTGNVAAELLAGGSFLVASILQFSSAVMVLDVFKESKYFLALYATRPIVVLRWLLSFVQLAFAFLSIPFIFAGSKLSS
ncbi:hypothetical protein BIT28_25075 [Photobacterium proteolyticum]|uniref:Uncharacterized protein n=1 Tax=Photobacterium proteolyticum TaxID=1903952 RepID=A0A1Q9GD19_9GAMM|nr:hypothetical protein [Photobacterium proteolyticum]OLQ72288.1 hypothetical protein BIT28_25075 [Photobacterium proteolyticum]